MTSSNCEMAAARSTELGFKGQIHIEREERRKVKGLETKMKKEWRNVKKRGTAQSNRERKQRVGMWVTHMEERSRRPYHSQRLS